MWGSVQDIASKPRKARKRVIQALKRGICCPPLRRTKKEGKVEKRGKKKRVPTGRAHKSLGPPGIKPRRGLPTGEIHTKREES